jgi:hypothetical protein
LTAEGVPLKNIATNTSALEFLDIRPCFIMARTMKTPMTGSTTIFAMHTETMAGIGKREIGRGILSRAKEAPKSINASGTVIVPTKFAIVK